MITATAVILGLLVSLIFVFGVRCILFYLCTGCTDETKNIVLGAFTLLLFCCAAVFNLIKGRPNWVEVKPQQDQTVGASDELNAVIAESVDRLKTGTQ